MNYAPIPADKIIGLFSKDRPETIEKRSQELIDQIYRDIAIDDHLIYLASPYSHEDLNKRLSRYRSVMSATAFLTNKRLHVFSPIMYAHEMALHHALQTDAVFWLDFNENILKRCSHLFVLTIEGWTYSHGVELELDLARKYGLPVFFI